VEQTAIVARLPNHDELKNRFIHVLLRGDVRDEEEVLREAQILGMDLSRPRAVLLIDAAGYIRGEDDAALQRRAQTVILSVVRFFSLPNATICAYIGDGEVAVLKASGTQDLASWTDGAERSDQSNPSWANLAALKRAGAALASRLERDTGAGITIGIGRYHPGLVGLAWSYRDARAALTLGRRAQRPGRVHCLDGLGAAAFVGVPDERTKVDLAAHLLTPLEQDEDLIETIEAYFAENCSPSLTSRRLAIHRNTLSYRLDKITSLTGLNPRDFDQAVQIRLSLLLRTLDGTADEPRTPYPAIRF
jgi:carbohydrate diacid regulator